MVSAVAQENGKMNSHFLQFDASIADTILNKLDPSEAITRTSKEKLKQHKNDIYLAIRDRVEVQVLQALEEKGIAVLDNEVLADYIKLGMKGYPLAALSPKGPIKKLKKGGYQADLYLTLNADLDLPSFSISSKGIQPVLQIRLNAWNADGKSVQKILHKERTKKAMLGKIDRDNEFIKFQQNEKTDLFSGKFVKFDKFRKSFIDLLLHELEPVIDDAVRNTVAKWK